MQANGNRQPVLQGTPAKALYAAFPNHAGVLSALLAECGVDAQCDAFEGEAGFFATSYANVYDRAALLDGLGSRFVALEVGFKPWPTTNRAHAFIEAALHIAASTRLNVADIQRVVVVGGPQIRTFCEPIQLRRHPTGWVQAEDSILFAVAKALVNGRVVLADFGPDGLRQSEVATLCDRLDYRIDPSVGSGGVVEVIAGRRQAPRASMSRMRSATPANRSATMRCAASSSTVAVTLPTGSRVRTSSACSKP